MQQKGTPHHNNLVDVVLFKREKMRFVVRLVGPSFRKFISCHFNALLKMIFRQFRAIHYSKHLMNEVQNVNYGIFSARIKNCIALNNNCFPPTASCQPFKKMRRIIACHFQMKWFSVVKVIGAKTLNTTQLFTNYQPPHTENFLV